jgi:hypothetical protein
MINICYNLPSSTSSTSWSSVNYLAGHNLLSGHGSRGPLANFQIQYNQQNESSSTFQLKAFNGKWIRARHLHGEAHISLDGIDDIYSGIGEVGGGSRLASQKKVWVDFQFLKLENGDVEWRVGNQEVQPSVGDPIVIVVLDDSHLLVAGIPQSRLDKTKILARSFRIQNAMLGSPLVSSLVIKGLRYFGPPELKAAIGDANSGLPPPNNRTSLSKKAPVYIPTPEETTFLQTQGYIVLPQ